MEVKFEEVEKLEAHNFQVAMKSFSNEVRFAERIGDLYCLTSETIPVELSTSLSLFMESGHALMLAVMSLMRCHHAQAIDELRRATECASYGHKTKDPELATIWITGQEDKRFSKNFRNAARFDTSHPEIKELQATWAFASEFASHATMGAVMGHQNFSNPEGFEYGFFDIEGDHVNNRGRHFWFILKAHMRILKVFEEVFEKSLSEKWKEDRRKVTAEAEGYIEKFIRPHLTRVQIEENKKKYAALGLVFPEDGMILDILKKRPPPSAAAKAGR